jgi:hypothetical protein
MPIRAKPYQHQQQAFDFACEKFGLTIHDNKQETSGSLKKKAGGENENLQK